jgi:hypothetical protein
MRLTCRRYLAAIPRMLFKQIDKLTWASNHWVLQIVIHDHTKKSMTAHGEDECDLEILNYHIRNPARSSAMDGVRLSEVITSDTAAYVLYHEGPPRRAISLPRDYGFEYAVAPQFLYGLVGRFAGGPNSAMSILGTLTPKIMGVESLAVFPTCIKNGANKIGAVRGSFEFISKFIDCTEAVSIFRRVK